MMTPKEERYVLANAYVPEHVPALMTGISGGEAFLIEDCFCCRKGDWVILVGYPLGGDFTLHGFERAVETVTSRFQPRCLSLVASRIPSALAGECRERRQDWYYTLDTRRTMPGGGIGRNIRSARQLLIVECADRMLAAHAQLMAEFIERIDPPPPVRRLMAKIPDYVAQAGDARVLNAWNRDNQLAAFYVVDLAAVRFANYIFGCYSKRNYVRGASDLLTWETVRLGRDTNKEFVHLGLGVNSGIRRFKEKWGGIPSLSYDMCELELRKPTLLDTLLAVMKMR